MYKNSQNQFYIRLKISKVANNQNMENVNLNLLVSCFISKLWNCSLHVPSLPKHIFHYSCLSSYSAKKTNLVAGEEDYYLFLDFDMIQEFYYLSLVFRWRTWTYFISKREFSWRTVEEKLIRSRLGGMEKTSFTLLFSFIHLSHMPASTSALEATTCGSTQSVLMKEPRGRHYNKAGQSGGAVLLSLLACLNTGPLFRCTW